MSFMAVRVGDFIEIGGVEEKTEPESDSQQIRVANVESGDNKQIDYTSASASKAYSLLSRKDNVLSMYSSNPLSSNINSGGYLETPRERFHRLQAEFLEFKEQMEFIVAKEKDIKISKDDTNRVLLAEISRVQAEIECLTGNDDIRRLIESNIDVSGKNPISVETTLGLLRRDLQKDLTESLIRRVKQLGLIKENAEQEIASSKIEIYLDKNSERVNSETKYIELERRLANMERTLGTSKLKKQETETSSNASQPILTRVETLSSQVNLLSADKSEIVMKRLIDLENQIEKVMTKRTALTMQNSILPQDLKRIETLHDRFQAVAGVADELPYIVDRMESLKTLHEESAGLMNHFHTLSSLHDKIVKGIANNSTLLNTVNTHFSTNLTKILNNMTNIESRIQILQK